jgi:6-phosphogluconolactonase
MLPVTRRASLFVCLLLISDCLSKVILPAPHLAAQGNTRPNADTQSKQSDAIKPASEKRATAKPAPQGPSQENSVAQRSAKESTKKSMVPFYIGTYTSGSSKGIHRCVLDTTSGELRDLQLVAELDNPSFLTIHPQLDVLYACSEIRRDGKREGAQLMAYTIDSDGNLSAIGGQPSGGNGPCYVSTDQSGKVALVANYGSGSIASLPISADGALGALATNIQHSGKSVNPSRQEGPHAHCIMTDPSNRYVCAVDLGLDQVLVYQLEIAQAKLTPKPNGNYHAKPGNGPRHIAFHPNGKHMFIIHEMGNVLVAAGWDATQGKITELSSASTLPPDYSGDSSTAEVLVHPSGKFVYGSNRGHDSIALFAFDEKTGKLALISHTSTGGKTPRNFRLDPTGNFLLAANQSTDSIVVFKIDTTSGKLTQVGQPLSVGAPCCIKFFARDK